jgi:hypothetical protein
MSTIKPIGKAKVEVDPKLRALALHWQEQHKEAERLKAEREAKRQRYLLANCRSTIAEIMQARGVVLNLKLVKR